jgi:hypothetical protein
VATKKPRGAREDRLELEIPSITIPGGASASSAVTVQRAAGRRLPLVALDEADHAGHEQQPAEYEGCGCHLVRQVLFPARSVRGPDPVAVFPG